MSPILENGERGGRLAQVMARGGTVADNKGNPLDIADPFARKLVGKYLENRKEDIARLTESLAAADFEALRLTGHNLYGSGAAYGLDEISRIGAAIESSAQSADREKLEQLIAELRDFLARVGVS